MFFSNELLSQRDSGFGLLWLAATLGSRSNLKKLPRRSILNADISSLCKLIEEPEEPLALRLSSNLMIGVTRIYVAKCEIFAADVSQLHASLKKAVFEMKTFENGLEDLVMPIASVRPGLITLSGNNSVSREFDLHFDLFEPFWGDMTTTDLSFGSSITLASPHSDRTFIDGPSSSQDNAFLLPEPQTPDMHRGVETPASARYVLSQEQRNRENHILNEDHLLMYGPTSDMSFRGFEAGGMDDGFQFGGDNMLGLELGDLDFGLGPEAFGEELADGFGVEQAVTAYRLEDFEMNFGETDLGMQQSVEGIPDAPPQTAVSAAGSSARKRPHEYSERSESPMVANGTVVNKLRRIRPVPKAIVDKRIELTDAELRASRDEYDQEQKRIAREIERKKRDKRQYLFAVESLWEVPEIFCAPELVKLWKETCRTLVIANKHSEDAFRSPEPPGKRHRGRRDHAAGDQHLNGGFGDAGGFDGITGEEPPNFQMDFDTAGDQVGVFNDLARPESRTHSRQVSLDTPELGRRALSHSHSALGLGSQRSSLLPWEQQAGFQSSDFDVGLSAGLSGAGGSMRDLAFGGSPGVLRIGRGSQELVPDGSLGAPPSRYASGSPALKFGAGEDIVNPSFNFGSDSQLTDTQQESQQSHLSEVSALERNSHNFFEYAKHLLAAKKTASIRLQDIAPVETSTPRVAAAAFYHSLVLATRSSIKIRQDAPYADVTISRK